MDIAYVFHLYSFSLHFFSVYAFYYSYFFFLYVSLIFSVSFPCRHIFLVCLPLNYHFFPTLPQFLQGLPLQPFLSRLTLPVVFSGAT